MKMSGNRIDIGVENKPIYALVDSEASFSIILETYHRLLQKVMFLSDTHVVLKVADGSYLRPMGKCNLHLIINERSFPFEFIVLLQWSHDNIFGWDFLETSSQDIIDCGQSEFMFVDLVD